MNPDDMPVSPRQRILICVLLAVAVSLIVSCSSRTSATSVRFGACADVHKDVVHDTDERMRTFIDAMKAAEVDFIVQLGDFCQPRESNRDFVNIFESFPGPAYHVLGNHDMDGGFTREQTKQYLGLESGFYSFDLRGFHFIVLDGNDRTDPPQEGYARYIGPEQREWLRLDLAKTKLPVIIFSHQSLGDTACVENSAEVRNTLENHNDRGGKVIACINGHSHFDGARRIGGIWYIHVNSMSYQWLGEKYPHQRYSEEIHRQYPYLQYTAPYRDSLYALFDIDSSGIIKIEGVESEWVGPSPWTLGVPFQQTEMVVPRIASRRLEF